MRGAAMTSLSRREPNQSSRKRRNQPGKHRGPDRRRPGTRSRPAPWGTPSTCGHSKHEPKQGNRHYTQTHPPPPQSQTHPDGGDKQTGLKKEGPLGLGTHPVKLPQKEACRPPCGHEKRCSTMAPPPGCCEP